jgi:putative tricarboxylic transport membrane protein
VRADSPLHDLRDLIEAWRNAPESVVVSGGSAVGGQDHMKMLLLAREAAIDLRSIRYVPFDGGGEAMTALLGGFVHIAAADASEIMGQLKARTIRLLAVLAKERLAPPLDHVPTATELGYPVDWVVWRGFYGPPGISENDYADWLATLEAVATSEAWNERCGRLGLRPFFLSGSEFNDFVGSQVRTFRELSRELGLIP